MKKKITKRNKLENERCSKLETFIIEYHLDNDQTLLSTEIKTGSKGHEGARRKLFAMRRGKKVKIIRSTYQ